MNNITQLKNFLTTYQAFDDIEDGERKALLQFLDAFGEFSYDRANLVGHICVSTWIVNKNRNKILMIYHNLFKTWAWVGGHADKDTNLLRVAIKGIQEETSVTKLNALSPYPIDINMMVVHNHYKNGKFVPRHLHPNIVYAFEADENETLRIKPDENSGIMWIKYEDLGKYCKNDRVIPYYERIMQKIKKIY